MKLYYFIAGLCLLGCSAHKDDNETAQDSTATTSTETPAGFFNIDFLQQEIDNAIQFQRQELRAEPEKIGGYLTRLDPNDPVSIPLAVHFIEGYPESPEAPVYDTLYMQFVALYYKVTMPFSDLFNTEQYVALLNEEQETPEDARLKNFLTYLDLYSIKPTAVEGGYDAEADPDFFYNVFSKKASPALRDFLAIQKKEMAEGFEMDAGLLIEYPQLYERIEAWGKFMKDHPDYALSEEALMNYQMYLRTLLFGMDNTPVFEDGILSADIKKLYETIQQQGKDSLSRKIITDYYAYLSKDGFKAHDENYQFMDQYDLGKAFGVKSVDEAK